MSIDKEKRQDKKKGGFWSNLFRSHSSKKNGKLGKERPLQSFHETRARPLPPDRVSTFPQQAKSHPRSQGGPVRAQTQVRSQRPAPVPVPQQQQHLPVPMDVDEGSVWHEAQVVADQQYPEAMTAKTYREYGKVGGKGKAQSKTKPNGKYAMAANAMLDGTWTEWPPRGQAHVQVPLDLAMRMISRGAPIHSGHIRDVPHMPDQYYSLFTTSEGNQTGRRGSDRNRGTGRRLGKDANRDRDGGDSEATDAADIQDSMIQLMTMRTIANGPGSPAADTLYPWETLEQPCRAFCAGRRPGTITLNYWAGTFSVLPPSIALRDSGVRPREVDLVQICQRLRDLQLNGLEDDNEDRLYRNLYRRLLRDPDRMISPHRTLDRQITDLILALTRPDYWIDFTHPRNQIVTRFIFDSSHVSEDQYVRFLHQLLLSLELDLRINSRHHNDWAKEKLLQQLPPTLQWDLALARRWLDYVRIDAYGPTPDQIQLRFKLKNRQIRMLRHFARLMKWPNLAATLATLKQRDADGSLGSVSSHAMAFFSGLVLPGPTFPFAIMNALIDVDPDRATDDLSMLTHTQPNCGFQYRNSYTYWTSTSIVGKVLAPTCHETAGWVGPARPTVDLGRSQIARIRSHRPQQHMTAEDIHTMKERSDPLGPAAEAFPVSDYRLVETDPSNIIDTVRIELLSLHPTSSPASSPGSHHNTGIAADISSDGQPLWFDAFVQFAIDGISWPMRLSYDVSFVYAWPCSNGPHPLFFDYSFSMVRADLVVYVQNWAAALHGTVGIQNKSMPLQYGASGFWGQQLPSVSKDGDDEKVLVIEAFGVPDTEVLARAWCAHWGLSAIVADVRKTCVSCAIREAYAATLTVVILVDGQTAYGDD